MVMMAGRGEIRENPRATELSKLLKVGREVEVIAIPSLSPLFNLFLTLKVLFLVWVTLHQW